MSKDNDLRSKYISAKALTRQFKTDFPLLKLLKTIENQNQFGLSPSQKSNLWGIKIKTKI